MPGWKTSTEGITEYDKLPKAAREYLAFIEKEAGAKIGMISTGPDRDQTICSTNSLRVEAGSEESLESSPAFEDSFREQGARQMVVLAVTWMAKVGHEAEVAALFSKADRGIPQRTRLPDVSGPPAQDRTRRFFIYEQYKDDAALEAHRDYSALPAICEERTAQDGRPGGRAFVRAGGLRQCQLSVRTLWRGHSCPHAHKILRGHSLTFFLSIINSPPEA